MRFSRIGAGLMVAGLAMSLVGCGGKDDTGGLPTGGGGSSTPPTSSAPTPTASTPSAEPTTSTQKYGPLTLVLNHTATTSVNAQLALRAYNDYERSSHKTLATNVEDPKLATLSAEGPLRDIRGILRDQKAKAVRTGGTITVTVKVAAERPTLIGFSGCYDQSKSLLVRANDTSYVGPGAQKTPKIKIEVVVTDVGGLWKVTEYNLKGDKC